VVKIAEVSTLRLRLPVPETIAPYVRDGDAATIRIDALGRTISGKVTRSTGALDASTRSMQVEVDVANADGSLTPGMYAQVTLNVRRAGNALVVPIQAIDTSGPQPILLVVNAQSRVERRAVQTGIATANRIEVLSGLREGEQVIVANQASFQPGELVTAKQSAMVAAGAATDATEGR
jgi:RND family efflux transporter MFP subunit